MLAKSGFPSSGEKSPSLMARSNQIKYQIKSTLSSNTGVGDCAGTTQEHAPATQDFLGKIGVVCPRSVRNLAGLSFWLSSPFCSSVFFRYPKITSSVATGGHDPASLSPL